MKMFVICGMIMSRVLIWRCVVLKNEESYFRFSKTPHIPKQHLADRRVSERRVIVVRFTDHLVRVLASVIMFLLVGIIFTGIVTYSRFEELNRKLMVEEISVPPIDIAIDQPLDDNFAEQTSPHERRR
jgi:uncharacterized membrane protein YraQ (UPF0718 family)